MLGCNLLIINLSRNLLQPSPSDGPRTTGSNCLGFCLACKDITQIKSRTISLFIFFFFLKQPYSCAVSTDALIVATDARKKDYNAFHLINDFDYNFNKILTLDIQIDRHRTVSNYIDCLTIVFTMLTSRSVIKLKDSIVVNTRSVWKSPTNQWKRIAAGIAGKLCVGRFIYCQVRRRKMDNWRICKKNCNNYVIRLY